jgi:importin subunit alpha-1
MVRESIPIISKLLWT